MSQRLDRVQLGGGLGRVDAEDDADGARDAEGQKNRPGGDDGLHGGEHGHDNGDDHAHRDADEAAADRKDDGFDQEFAW